MTAARVALTTLWLLQPVVSGPALDAALAVRTPSVQHVAAAGLWAGWFAGIVCLLVPRTSSLTAFRLLAPGALAAPVLAVVIPTADAPGAADAAGNLTLALALAMGAAVSGVALTAWIGHAFVNGSSYGDERRYVLRPPTAVLVGPLPLAWVLLVGLPTAGALLLASGVAGAGAACLLLAVPTGALVVRAAHGLARRWLVFVPAGVVVHDYTALVDSVLVQKRHVRSITPATVRPVAADGSDPLDLTAGGRGLVVQLDFTEPIPVTPRPRARPGTGVVAETVEVTAVLVAPSRPGALLSRVR